MWWSRGHSLLSMPRRLSKCSLVGCRSPFRIPPFYYLRDRVQLRKTCLHRSFKGIPLNQQVFEGISGASLHRGSHGLVYPTAHMHLLNSLEPSESAYKGFMKARYCIQVIGRPRHLFPKFLQYGDHKCQITKSLSMSHLMASVYHSTAKYRRMQSPISKA